MKTTRKFRKSVEVGSQVLEGEDERECRPDGGWRGALPRCSEFFSIMDDDDGDEALHLYSSQSFIMVMVTMMYKNKPALSAQLCLSKEGE